MMLGQPQFDWLYKDLFLFTSRKSRLTVLGMNTIRLRQRFIFQAVLVAITIISFTLSIWEILTDPEKFQWDLNVYYNAPLELLQGLDPYKVSHFVYPPVYLQVFKVFSTWLSYDQFYSAFLFAKIFCFIALLWIWRNFFLKRVPIGVFLLLVWLGFYSTFLLDFQAGNISVFETTLLFLAFVCFLKDRLGLFVALILLAASFKLTPVFFLILLPLYSKRNRRLFFLGCFGFLAYGVLNYLVYPEFTRTFISEALSRTGESGFVCPSSLAFVTDIWTHMLANWDFIPTHMFAKITYVALAFLILWRSFHDCSQASRNGSQILDKKTFLVLFSILVFTLTMPRMKDYAYMIAIPSLIYAIHEFDLQIPRWVLFLPLVLIPPTTTWPLFFQEAFRQFWSYYPLFLATLFWFFYLKETHVPPTTTPPTGSLGL